MISAAFATLARFFEGLRGAFRDIRADYNVSSTLMEDGIADFISPPLLGDDAGVCGALALAQKACCFVGKVKNAVRQRFNQRGVSAESQRTSRSAPSASQR